MRLWTWEVSGPDTPDTLNIGDSVYDDEDLCWTLSEDNQWWPPSDPDVCPDDMFGCQMPWSTLLEARGPLRNKPRQSAPMPSSEVS